MATWDAQNAYSRLASRLDVLETQRRHDLQSSIATARIVSELATALQGFAAEVDERLKALESRDTQLAYARTLQGIAGGQCRPIAPGAVVPRPSIIATGAGWPRFT